MSKLTVAAALLAVLTIGGTPSPVPAQPSAPGPADGATVEPMGPGMMGGGMMGGGMMASTPRHRFGMMGGIPEPYRSMSNPLPRTAATIERGAMVYRTYCASCHGATGAGDGPAARALSPPPPDLGWLTRMPMVRSDSYMYWSIAEGGAQFGTAMPAFKNALSKDQIWAVIAYIQEGLPQPSKK
jgi:mono/diheme cytochrome c family protein